MVEPLLSCTNVSKSFPSPTGPVSVLKSVTLALQRSEMVAILGESGAGKTTLLHLVGAIDRFLSARPEALVGRAAERGMRTDHPLLMTSVCYGCMP